MRSCSGSTGWRRTKPAPSSSQQLRARALSEPVAQLIREKAEGHPFFAEELAHALRDRGLVEVQDGVCRFTAAAERQSMQLPNTVQVVVKSRIDQLTVPQQLTIKVASVLGRAFDLTSLRAVYPIAADEHGPAGPSAGAGRSRSRSPLRTGPGADLRLQARHHAGGGLQPAAVRLAAAASRRGGHRVRAAARGRSRTRRIRCSRTTGPGRRTPSGRCSISRKRARRRSAGTPARRRCVSSARRSKSTRSRPIRSRQASGVSLGRRVVSARDARRIRWHRRLGDASINLGRWDEGRTYFEQALKMVGQTLPVSDRAWAVGLGAQILIQCARRLTPKPFRSRSQAPELLLEAVSAYGRVGASAYLYDRMIQVLYSLIAALNLAERLPPTPEFALSVRRRRQHARPGPAASPRPASTIDWPCRRPRDSTIQESLRRIRARTAVYQLGIGNWDSCRHLDAAMSLCDQIGDTYVWEENATIRVARRALDRRVRTGRPAWRRDSDARAHDRLARPRDLGIRRSKCGACSTRAMPTWRWNWRTADSSSSQTAAHTDRAVAARLPRRRRRWLTSIAEIWNHAWLGAQRIFEVMANAPRPRYFALLYLNAAAEVCLARWEARKTPVDASEAEHAAPGACADEIEQYAHINLSARARSLLVRGSAEWLGGRQKAAQRDVAPRPHRSRALLASLRDRAHPRGDRTAPYPAGFVTPSASRPGCRGFPSSEVRRATSNVRRRDWTPAPPLSSAV